MPKLSERGIIHLLLPLILLIGIIAGVFLITNGNPLKLFSHASNPPIVVQDVNGNALPTNNNIPYTTNSTVKVSLTSTLGGPQSGLSAPIPQPSPSPQSPYTVAISTGNSWIGPVVTPASNLTAEDFLKQLNSGFSGSSNPSPVRGIVRISQQPPQTHFLGRSGQSGDTNFPIKIGEGYQIVSMVSGTSVFTGTLPQTVTYTLNPGNNFISLPFLPANVSTAEDFLQMLKKQGIAVYSLQWTSGNNNQGHSINSQALNFKLVPGGGYMLSLAQKATFTISRPTTSSQVYTVSYQLAENPSDLGTSKANSGSYNQEPLTLNYTFKDTLVGKHFIWVRFTDSSGKTDDRSQEVDIVTQGVSTPITQVTKRVFVTSTTYTGNLGGLAGADASCQSSAKNANLGGTWKAWLSDTTTSAASRLNHSTGSYTLLNGTVIANNWSDLTDGSINHAINLSEYKSTVDAGNVWTNTTRSGEINRDINIQPAHCQKWTNGLDSGVNNGGRGSIGSTWSGSTNYNWTESGYNHCSGSGRLFCFEQ